MISRWLSGSLATIIPILILVFMFEESYSVIGMLHHIKWVITVCISKTKQIPMTNIDCWLLRPSIKSEGVWNIKFHLWESKQIQIRYNSVIATVNRNNFCLYQDCREGRFNTGSRGRNCEQKQTNVSDYGNLGLDITGQARTSLISGAKSQAEV